MIYTPIFLTFLGKHIANNFCAQVLDRADFTIPVEIEGQYHNIYVIKRPGVDQFMKRVGELYEVVVFTASVSKVCCRFPKDLYYAPVANLFTVWRSITR